MKFLYVITCVLMSVLSNIDCYAQSEDALSVLEFKSDHAVLLQNYRGNFREIVNMRKWINTYEDVILTGNGHIRLVASIPKAEKKNPQAINLAASRAAVVRTYLRQQYRMLTNWCFTFYIDADGTSDNTLKVEYIATPIPDHVATDIYYTLHKDNPSYLKGALAKYSVIPYLENVVIKPDNPPLKAHLDSIATNPVRINRKEAAANPVECLVAIYYRWDKHNLDSMYLSNPQQLATLDSILSSVNVQHIDTMTIVAFASPEGHPDYNQRLSERRANTIRNYILSRYPQMDSRRIVTIARGENWEGLLKFALNDPQLPSREKVLEIITSSKSDLQKQSELTKLDGGKTYYRYILPNYYRYLRNGASVFISYRPSLPALMSPAPLAFTPLTAGPLVLNKGVPAHELTIYPIAIRTNLLYDAVGALNIGIEVPFGKRKNWSWIGDVAYSYWRSPQNLYALQTLEYGTELRYWFGGYEKYKERDASWAKPLRGWNIGVYGHYWQRYDVQWIDGYQGDDSWSAGITVGYAFPIVKNLSLEASLGGGWFATSEYRHYHQPEYDKEGNYHLMWQQTGSWSGLSITKVRFSLIWLIESRLKGGHK